MDTIYFAKLKEDAIIPSKRDEDGCYDLYACFDDSKLVLNPHQVKLIPTGIATAFDKKYRLSLRERGSNTKTGLIVMAGQIDSGYRGEIFVALYNSGDYPVTLTKERKEFYQNTINHKFWPVSKAICQAALEEVPIVDVEEIDYDELLKIDSDRGIGKLGSSEK